MGCQRGALLLLSLLLLSLQSGVGAARSLTFRLGASIGKDGACAPLYQQTAQGYQYFVRWLQAQGPITVSDLAGNNLTVSMELLLVTHNCTEPGRQAALNSLIAGTAADPAAKTPAQPPVHLLLGGNGENAAADAEQAEAASRILLHCCTARDSVYTAVNRPHVYGLFTPASQYTGPVLRSMAFAGISRLAVVFNTASQLHQQLCLGALRQLPQLRQLRPGFAQQLLVVNYTALQADTPGFWDDLGNRISDMGADALVACDEMHHTTELVRWLHGRHHRLAATWLASYGNTSDFLTHLDGQGEYALTTVQWLPSMPYADSYFGTAAQYAAGFTAAMGNPPSYFSAAATAAGLVLLTALEQSIQACDVGSLTQGQAQGPDGLEGVDADAFMWGAQGMLCSGVGGNRSGVLGTEQLRYALDTLSADTFFGPVEFNAFRQNSIHPALVTQVVGDRLVAVLPVDLAEAPLVMPVPVDPAPSDPWATTPAGIVIITLACCLSVAVAALVAALMCTRRARRSGRVAQPSIELDLAEIKVELAPSRNVDGTFEPGEGMYRGVRVKLVVATELLSQLGGLPTTPGALTGLPPPQVPPSLIPASPAVPTFVRGSANIDAVPEDSSVYVFARGSLRSPPPEVPLSTSPWASAGPIHSALSPLHQSPTPSAGQRTSDDSSADPLPRRLQQPQRAQSGGEQSSTTLAPVVQKASSFLSEEGVVLGLAPGVSGAGMTGIRTPTGQVGVAASDAHRSSQSGARACELDTATLAELRPVGTSQSGVTVPKAQFRQWKARIGALVWRAVRLHHPNICPIMGIVWEWPGLLDNGGTVPIVVRCWYGFGNLARLLENETVPLPLLTKATIARGVAEAMAHLHQQSPPIVAGPLDTERIIIDDHFNPHMFLRLTSMDERYGSASAVQNTPNRGNSSMRWDRAVAASVPAVLKRVTKYIPSPSVAGRSPKAEVYPTAFPSPLPRGEDLQHSKQLKQQQSSTLAEVSHVSGHQAEPTVHVRLGQEDGDLNAYMVVVDTSPAVEGAPEDADEIEPEHPSVSLADAQAAVSSSKSTPGIAPTRLLSGLKAARPGTATGVLPSSSPSQLPGSPRVAQLLAQPSPCAYSASGLSQLQQHLQQQQQQQSLGPGGLSVKAGQEYVPSREQDVYDFGRLLCNIFVMSERGSHSVATPGLTGRLAVNTGGGAAGGSTPAGGGNESAWARVLASRPASGHLFPMGRSPWEEEAERQAAVHALQESVSEELANLVMACMRTDPAARPTLGQVLQVWDTVVFPSLCAAGRAVANVPLGVELGSPVDSVWQGGAGVWSNEGREASDSDGNARPGAPGGLRAGRQERALLAPVIPRSGGSPGGDGDAGVSTAGERTSPIDGWLPWQRAAAAAAAGVNGGAAARRNSTAVVKPVAAKNASFTKLNKRALGHNVTSDDLLFDIFPPKVARALMAGEPVQPERYDCVSIFFSDIVGYTDLCGQLQPHEVMDMVDRLYSLFDALIQSMQLFKVETVGDAYLAVANLRCPQPDSHARLMAQFAFAAVAGANALPVHPERPELGCLHIRVGLHCGPVVASVVGALNRRYCLFGDAVNTAARMEHNSEADRVHCSAAFAALLAEQWPAAGVASRGVRPIKGKGPMETCWLSPPAGWHPGAITRGSEDRPAARRRSLAEQQVVEIGV